MESTYLNSKNHFKNLSSELCSYNFQAIICDMDGLLVDSESWTFRAWILACRELGYELSEKVAFSGVGKGRGPFKKMLTEHFGPTFDANIAEVVRTRVGEEMLVDGGLKKRPGAEEFLETVLSLKIPLGLASSTFKGDALLRLKYSGISSDIFDALTFGDEVSKLKPDPEIYLTTASKLGVLPENAIAFEDSFAGVTSALSAGLRVVCIPDMEKFTPLDNPKFLLKNSLFDCLD